MQDVFALKAITLAPVLPELPVVVPVVVEKRPPDEVSQQQHRRQQRAQLRAFLSTEAVGLHGLHAHQVLFQAVHVRVHELLHDGRVLARRDQSQPVFVIFGE